MKEIKFNEFEKYTKKDKLYLIFYLIMLGLSLAMIILNAIVLAFDNQDIASIVFVSIFSVIALFVMYLLFMYLIVPKKVLSINYEKETITINKHLFKSITLNLKDINEIKITDKKLIFNVVNLGSVYFLTDTKTYRAKYLISPKYLMITLNIYLSVVKDGGQNVK